ncbi:MAG TPA: ABC transporter permease [Thermoleophilaceae bacterium]|nr:ABC transporter permease [Thermoleophilaceae bacterium]
MRTGGRRPDDSLAAVARRRVVLGLLTMVLLSMLVFAATEVLPGDAARAVLGNSATPARLKALQEQLHLDAPVPLQYLRWAGDLVRGDLGNSLANGGPVSEIVGPRLLNSAFLIFLAGAIGSVLGVLAGVIAAARRDRLFDTVTSVASLALSALPEFVVALGLITLLSTLVLHAFPAVSVFPSGTAPWEHPDALVLPVATLVILIFPYIFRMTRATMIEALASDYAELAELKGLDRRRVLFAHALPNAAPAIVQVIALNFLYLAGGIVVVEYVFNYQGLGQALVGAVDTRDIPVIQCIVLILAGFYLVVNIASDLLAVVLTPRRRFRSSP